ncbi:hypothetical protein [Crocosphaera sp.]|uniref:hypothetical protein n=1 Tax=Crocosphaera sp. TaxID=2729996 RepID=UPI003F259958|nr:hypothetical protein [Crocosphaera sp.]
MMNFISINQFLLSALRQPWTAIYTKLIAIALIYGATVHISNILGLTGTSWLSTPFLWQSMDILLLIFDLTTAIALWRGLPWSIWGLFTGILFLQIIPYTLFRDHFILKPEDHQILNSLLGTEILLLSIFLLLLYLRK